MTGQSAAYRRAVTAGTQDAYSNVWANYNNLVAQQQATAGQLLAGLGQQEAAELTRVQQANAANRAAATNMQMAAWNQLAGWGQREAQNRSQRNMNAIQMPMIQTYLQSVLPASQYEQFKNIYQSQNGRYNNWWN
jgi:hypothetical protein